MLIILIIFIVFILLNYILNIQEYFTDPVPVPFPTGRYCPIGNEYGMRMSDNSCIKFNDSAGINSTKDFSKKYSTNNSDGKSAGSGDGAGEGADDGAGDGAGDGSGAGTGSSSGSGAGDGSKDDSNIDCVPIKSNYGQICKNKYNNSNDYGVSKITQCVSETDKNNHDVRVECKKMFFDKVDYSEHGPYATECIDSSLDFDTMCNYYMQNDIKKTSKKNGYNINSSGVSVKLKGKTGDCYLSNGLSDLSKTRGICGFKRENTIDRVRPFMSENNYNKFTECNNMESHDFVNDCANILNKDSENVFADINGFDCMPGYARAKCINKEDAINIPPNLAKFYNDSQ